MQIIADKKINTQLNSLRLLKDRMLYLRRYYAEGTITASEYVAARTEMLRGAKLAQKVSRK